MDEKIEVINFGNEEENHPDSKVDMGDFDLEKVLEVINKRIVVKIFVSVLEIHEIICKVNETDYKEKI